MLNPLEKEILNNNLNALIEENSQELFTLSFAVSCAFYEWVSFTSPKNFDFYTYCKKYWLENCRNVVRNHHITKYIIFYYSKDHSQLYKHEEFEDCSFALRSMYCNITHNPSCKEMSNDFLLQWYLAEGFMYASVSVNFK